MCGLGAEGVLLALALMGGAARASPMSYTDSVAGVETTIIDDTLTGEGNDVSMSGTEGAGRSVTLQGGFGQLSRVQTSRRYFLLRGGFFDFPYPYARLLVLVPGETASGVSATGKTGKALAHVVGSTFTLNAYAADLYFQPVTDAPPDSVRIFGIDPFGTPLPSGQPLESGATAFSGFTVTSGVGSYLINVRDDGNGGILQGTARFPVVGLALSSPTVQLNIAMGATYATLGGGISGTAFDPTGVQRVALAVRQVSNSYFYDPGVRAFVSNPAVPVDPACDVPPFFCASLGRRAATSTTWYFELPDAAFTNGEQYEVRVVADNPSGFERPTSSTFTFDTGGLAFSRYDGQAAASVFPLSAPGCAPVLASVTVTMAGIGIDLSFTGNKQDGTPAASTGAYVTISTIALTFYQPFGTADASVGPLGVLSYAALPMDSLGSLCAYINGLGKSYVCTLVDGKSSDRPELLTTQTATDGIDNLAQSSGFKVPSRTASGMGPGGAVALRLPAGWGRPASVRISSVPADTASLSAGAVIVDTSATSLGGAVRAAVNPQSFGAVTLGDGWVLVSVATGAAGAVRPGERLVFSFEGQPPLGPQGRGSQSFDVRMQAAGAGTLLPIPAPPSIALTPGAALGLAFADAEPLAQGPLQTSATMQLRTVDLCGNLALAQTNLVVAVEAGTLDSSKGAFVGDSDAAFCSAGSSCFQPFTTPIANADSLVPPFRVAGVSPGLYFLTSSRGPRTEYIHAYVPSGGVQEVYRSVGLNSSSITLQAVSVDTGTVATGAKTALLAPGGTAVIRFTLAESSVAWEALLSTSPAFDVPVLRASGFGDPDRPLAVSWDGVDSIDVPSRSARPGTYRVLLRAGGGTVEDRSLSIQIPSSPFIYGRLGASGAGAVVRADGPGSNPGSFAVASSTGYFELYGLTAGRSYTVTASTRVVILPNVTISSVSVELSTAAFGVTAAVTGGSAGTLAFDIPGFFLVSVTLPAPSPADVTGQVVAHSSDFSRVSVGVLHFAASAGTSDDGGQGFGQNAATWTVVAVPAGTYDLDFNVPQVGLSTSTHNQTIAANQVEWIPIPSPNTFIFPHKANVYGYVILPSTQPLGSWVSVQAAVAVAGSTVTRSAAAGAILGGTFVPGGAPVRSSAPYALYGLDPGTWTIIAQSVGFVPSAASVLVVSTTDIGEPVTSTGVVLTLGLGGILAGTLNVQGDSRPLAQACLSTLGPACPPSGFIAYAQTYDLQTFAVSNIPVAVTADSRLASAPFTITGLTSGAHLLRAFLPGFQLQPAGGTPVTVSTPAVASAVVSLGSDSARFSLAVRLPPPAGGGCYSPAAFQSLGFYVDLRPDAAPAAGGDITALTPSAAGASAAIDPASSTTETYYCSSMTFLSAPAAPGSARAAAWWGPTGGFGALTVPLAQGATTPASLDLSAAGYNTITGTVSVGGGISFARADGSVVNVSSAPGLVSQAAVVDYCLLSSSAPTRLSAARIELVPIAFAGDSPGPLLRAADAGGNCRAFAASGAFLADGTPSPAYLPPTVAAYVGAIRPDGSFSISSVPAGAYLLRNVPDLDGDPSNGLEAAEIRISTTIRSSGSVGLIALTPGAAVRGQLLAPPGVPLTRAIRVTLADTGGRAVQSADVQLAGAEAAAFVFPRLAAGQYLLKASDLGFPQAYAAASRAVVLGNGDLGGLDLQLVAAGAIRANLAVESLKADGTHDFVAVGAANPELLPSGLKAYAVADPFFAGGFFNARGKGCDQGVCGSLALDSNGQLVIDGVLPGVYDVVFVAPDDPAAVGQGGLALASQVKAGVTVVGGQTVDLGLVRLPAAASLSGRVADAATGLPAANVRVIAVPTVRQPGDQSASRQAPAAVTDAAGRYALSGLDPQTRIYDVIAAVRPRQTEGDAAAPFEQRLAAAVDLRSTGTVNFALVAASSTLSGRVVADSGEALVTTLNDGQTAGAVLHLEKGGQVPIFDPLGDIQWITDSQGRFHVPSLTTGTWRLVINADGRAPIARTVDIKGGTADIGVVTLSGGGTLWGRVAKPDGSAPSEDEVTSLVAVTSDFAEYLSGGFVKDDGLRTVAGYRVSGFKANLAYRILIGTTRGELVAPAEGASVVFTSTREVRGLDLVYRPPPPAVLANASKQQDGSFHIDLEFTQPLRARTPSDDDLDALVGTPLALGTIRTRELSSDRSRISLAYAPGSAAGVVESSFSVLVQAYSAYSDPSSTGSVNREFRISSGVAVHVGLDGFRQGRVNNFEGGEVALDDGGRLRLPKGAFAADPASAVQVLFQRTSEPLSVQGRRTAAANLAALRYPVSAYPVELASAFAATPPDVAPAGPYYQVSLPAGIPGALAKPAQICVGYSQGQDPALVNLYWYSPGANAYVLQQDPSGAAPFVDTNARIKCIQISHFSTFVLLNSGVAAISGNSFTGDHIEGFAFPNPFDLSVKTVNPIHGASAQTIRGTMLRFGLPASASGAGTIAIYNVAGEKVRTIDLGQLAGGAYYYQPWDGTNDSGRGVASGVYVAEVKAGGQTGFFKMAVIK